MSNTHMLLHWSFHLQST